jgi:hypothetical protein
VDGTVIDSVDDPEPPATEEGLTVAVQPEGADTVKETVPLKPLSDATLIKEDPEDPAGIVKAEGDAETE